MNQYQNQHYISRAFIKRFADKKNGHVKRFNVKWGTWSSKSPRYVFSGFGFTQLLIEGEELDNSLEIEFGKVESSLPITLAALDKAATRPTTELPTRAYENMCWYCAFLLCMSPFAKAKAPADFLLNIHCDLANLKTEVLEKKWNMPAEEIEYYKREVALGKKLIFDAENYLQYLYRVQFIQMCKEMRKIYRFQTTWTVYNSPIDLPLSDIALVEQPLVKENSIRYALPISPRLLLMGKVKMGANIEPFTQTTINSGELSAQEADYWLHAICASAVVQLASKRQIAELPAIRQRASDMGIKFVKIKNLDAIKGAGTKVFNKKFFLRPVSQEEHDNFISTCVEK
jgi:hypothetical protein